MKINILMLALVIFITGCATTVDPNKLTFIENSHKIIHVSEFIFKGKDNASSYKEAMIGVKPGLYTLELEDDKGEYYRGKGNSVKILELHNFNKEQFPNSIFPGGIYIPKDGSSYRIYYYQFNLKANKVHSTLGQEHVMKNPTIESGVGVGIGIGLVQSLIANGYGKIVIMSDIDSLDVTPFVEFTH